MRICPDTPARSRPSLHHSMNSPTVISSFIAGITMLSSTSSGVVSCGRRCSIAPALFLGDRCSTCITVGCNESEAAEARLGALFSEIERAFFERVPVNDRPRIHKHDLEIEQDEEHCHNIELNAEPRLRFALRNHPAFIRGVFRSRPSSAFAYEDADEQR